VWPDTEIQLCQWHVDRAIKKKLASRKRIQHTKYKPEEAIAEFDFIDPTFVPDLQCPEAESTVCPLSLRKIVISLVRKHFNMHPKIPINATGEFWSRNEIYQSAVHEMYDFCLTNGLALLWAYLWSSWYKPARWLLWARSAHANIPLIKTNMVIESHWKVLKHSYLYRFNRPRLDYLVWVICNRTLPDQVVRFKQLQLGRQTPSWFSEFKNTWKQLAAKVIACGVDERHYTDFHRWICSCPAFLGSRFLLCKHLVHHAVEAARSDDPEGIRLVYNNFKRHEDYPFLTWNSSKQGITHQANESTSRETTVGRRSLLPDGDDEIQDPDIRETCEMKVAAVKRMAEHLEQELSANNLQHVSRVVNNLDHLFTMLGDIESSRRKRRRDQTWKGSKSWTMFLQ
jgi:hypothetical protein